MANKRIFTDSELRAFSTYYRTHTNKECAQKYGLTCDQVRNIAYTNSFKKDKEQRKKSNIRNAKQRVKTYKTWEEEFEGGSLREEVADYVVKKLTSSEVLENALQNVFEKMNIDRLMSLEEMQALLGKDTKELARRTVMEKNIPHIAVGNILVFKESEVIAYFEEQRRKSYE